MIKLTEAQRKALDWLPSDGSERYDAGRLRSALNSLSFVQVNGWSIVKGSWKAVGSRGGNRFVWKLTSEGVKFKASGP